MSSHRRNKTHKRGRQRAQRIRYCQILSSKTWKRIKAIIDGNRMPEEYNQLISKHFWELI